ncbi:MAG: hypothetical protein QOD57_1635, partial [Actinomycetota bacterium]|nr:hypothetical protein [Actinomycetota bacterium]
MGEPGLRKKLRKRDECVGAVVDAQWQNCPHSDALRQESSGECLDSAEIALFVLHGTYVAKCRSALSVMILGTIRNQ